MEFTVRLVVLLGLYNIVSTYIIGLSEYKRVCYFTNWAQYRKSPMSFSAGDIDPFLCTHLIYAFSQLDGNNMTTEGYNDIDLYSRILDLKTINPSLKVILAVGGWSHGVERFSAMAATDQNIEEFADNAISFLRRYRLDGLDLDWEYPSSGANSWRDKYRFTRLVQILHQRFQEEGTRTTRRPLLLSAAVSAGKWTIDDSYQIDLISKDLDFINLMSYDFHGSWESTTGHNSPLYARSDEQGFHRFLNQAAAVRYWISLGAPPHKLVLGLALYGRTFTLANNWDFGLGAPTTGPGVEGPYTNATGYLAYYEICKYMEQGWTRVWDDEHQVPYAYSGDQWVGYDDIQSFTVKAEFIKEMKLAGSMVWAIDLDDFKNICGEGVNPLMGVLKNALEYHTVDPITERPVPSTTNTPATSTTDIASTTNTPATSTTDTASTANTPATSTTDIASTAYPVTTDNPTGVHEFKRVCYFTNWAQYRPQPMDYTADNIDPFICTHIVYAFSQLNGNDMAIVEWNDLSTYQKVMNLKVTNPHLKVLLAVGGYNHGVERFSDMVSSDQAIEEFADNTIVFLRNYGFDGLDLDWEYPTYDTSGPNDKYRFTRLTQILRREFDKEGTSSNRPSLLLTAAVAASIALSDAAYEINLISQSLDFINLMTYDFHGPWDPITGHNSPLYPRQSENTFQKTLNQDAVVRYWLSKGTPPHKLVLGLALYGRSFTLASTNDVGLDADVVGAGMAAPYTKEAGYIGYFEICDQVKNQGWTRVWEAEHKVPFTYSGNQWIGYDDVESFTIKAEYIKSNRLGGSMLWAMDLDDFNNVCGLGVNPMMSVLKTILSSPIAASTTPPPSSGAPTTDTATDSTSQKPTQTTSGQSTKPSTTTQTMTTTTSTNAATTSTDPNNCAPTVCPDATIIPSTCDPACVFQCCNGSHVEYCCDPGYIWNNVDANCQKIVLSTTTSSPISTSPVNCDAPSTCTHGTFLPDPCDDQCYYNCGHGIAYHMCCAAGRVWDNYIKDCNYPELIQDDLNCRPKVCPPFTFLPEPCVPSCYYQCSSTGLDVRFCCYPGTIWDDTIKACNYPPAVDSPNKESDTSRLSKNEVGNPSRSGSNIITHQINFTACGEIS